MLTITQRADFRRVMRLWLEDCKCPVSIQPEPDDYKLDCHELDCKFRQHVELTKGTANA